MYKYGEIVNISNGVFNHINYDFMFDKIKLDNLFFLSNTYKITAPLVDYWINDETLSIPDNKFDLIGEQILAIFKNKWDRSKSLLKEEYDPIHNYLDKMEETVTGEENTESQGTKDVDATRDVAGASNQMDSSEESIKSESSIEKSLSGETSSTRTDDLKENSSFNGTESVVGSGETGIAGLNSSSFSGQNNSSSDSTATTNSTTETKNTGTQKNSGKTESKEGSNGLEEKSGKMSSSRDIARAEVTTDASKQTTTDTVERNTTKERQMTHSGNIGNITTQQLIREELELWKWNFIDMVMKDVASVIFIPIYIC